MSDWRAKPRTGKHHFLQFFSEITKRIADGETQKSIFDDLQNNNNFKLSYPQFHRYVNKLVLNKEITEKPIKKSFHIEKDNKNNEKPLSIEKNLLDDYLSVCFDNERLAQKAIEKGISIQTIKSWNCVNKIRLGNVISSYKPK